VNPLRLPWRRVRQTAGCAALAFLVLAAAGQRPHPVARAAPAPAPNPPPRQPVTSAYYEGKLVNLTLDAPADSRRSVLVGPWDFGQRVSDPKPRDKRLNFYLVCWEDYDHNLLINALSPEGQSGEWDVYYAIVLDPGLREDVRRERQLILAAQSRFLPGDLYELDDAPGSDFLRLFLHAETLEDLAPYRRRDGSLPRLILVRAGFAVRASAVSPEPPPASAAPAAK
jgi:hypothetical protein